MSNGKTFYDIHCHAFNLSHAGLLAFLNRFLKDKALTFSDIINGRFLKVILSRIPGMEGILYKIFAVILPGTAVCFAFLFSNGGIFLRMVQSLAFVIGVLVMCILVYAGIKWFFKGKPIGIIKRIINLLSIIENDTGSMFLYMEKDIRIKLNEKTYNYDKVILTPLLIDFGYKCFDIEETEIQYKHPPSKPISEQVVDVFNGIKNYIERSPFRIFEIYPFMGINTRYYKLGITLKISEDSDVDKKIANSVEQLPPGLRKKVFHIKETGKIVIGRIITGGDEDEWFKLFERDKEKKEIKNILGEKIKESRTHEFIKENNIPKMLDKYFGEYTGRYSDFAHTFERTFGTISPEFRRDEFRSTLSIQKLCRLTKGSKYEKGAGDSIDWLNKMLEIPDFYETVIAKIQQPSFSKSVECLIDETSEYRKKRFRDLDACEKDAIKRFNRLLIEETCPHAKPSLGIDIKGIDDIRSHFFAGVKLYPPLGFDPWPEDNETEFDKVNLLYQFCSDKGIPVTVHCLNAGFLVSENHQEYTNPEKWEKVLTKYENIRINFAHCGIDETFGRNQLPQWTQTVFNLIKKYENVYGDLAIVAKNKEFYANLEKWMDKHGGKIKDRILFGSDFPLHLFDNDSYEVCLRNFFDSKSDLIDKFCHENPERFLFK